MSVICMFACLFVGMSVCVSVCMCLRVFCLIKMCYLTLCLNERKWVSDSIVVRAGNRVRKENIIYIFLLNILKSISKPCEDHYAPILAVL
ncbi:hypothetical protein SKAU_G00002370 [Synaphobranchus kaupii]|uniref:Uncharacterized protein n=1 Tax=Synaphobranchus kaupii TaxID=118154 RepID=A0A9Q1G8G7_SYNKA|nr:hypothetical protein SKAU_G00002370 [Synaphobranchus kaupii]